MSKEFDYTKLKHITSVDQPIENAVQFKTKWANES